MARASFAGPVLGGIVVWHGVQKASTGFDRHYMPFIKTRMIAAAGYRASGTFPGTFYNGVNQGQGSWTALTMIAQHNQGSDIGSATGRAMTATLPLTEFDNTKTTRETTARNVQFGGRLPASGAVCAGQCWIYICPRDHVYADKAKD